MLAAEGVDELAADSGGAMDEGGVAGEGGDDGHAADVVAHPVQGMLVNEHLLALGRHVGALYALYKLALVKGAGDGEVGHAFLKGVGFAAGVEAAGHGKEVNGLQDIGLARAIVAGDGIDVGAEFRAEVAVVAELGQLEVGEVHGANIVGIFEA